MNTTTPTNPEQTADDFRQMMICAELRAMCAKRPAIRRAVIRYDVAGRRAAYVRRGSIEEAAALAEMSAVCAEVIGCFMKKNPFFLPAAVGSNEPADQYKAVYVALQRVDFEEF